MSDENVSLQDRATIALDAAIEDAFERGAVVGAAENGGYEDGYEDGFAAGADEADKVQYNRGHSDGYSKGFKDSAEVSDIQINELIKQKEAAYNKGKQEAQRDYMAARESIGNATGELDELRKSVNILYSDIESLYLDAKEGSKAEFALVTILNTFEDAGPLDKAMNA